MLARRHDADLEPRRGRRGPGDRRWLLAARRRGGPGPPASPGSASSSWRAPSPTTPSEPRRCARACESSATSRDRPSSSSTATRAESPSACPISRRSSCRSRVDLIVAVGFQAATAAKGATAEHPGRHGAGRAIRSSGAGDEPGPAGQERHRRGAHQPGREEQAPGASEGDGAEAHPGRRARQSGAAAPRHRARAAWRHVSACRSSGWSSRGPRRSRPCGGGCARRRCRGIYTVESPLIDGIAPRIAEIAREQRLPSVFPFREAVEGGGLMSYATSFAETQRRAASYVHRLLKGPGRATCRSSRRTGSSWS